MRRHVQLLGVALLALVVATPTARAQNGLPPGKWTVIILGRESGFGECGYPGTYEELVADMPQTPGGSENWMYQIANRIRTESVSTPVSIYRMSTDVLDLVSYPPGEIPGDPTRHHVLLFDWARTSGIMTQPGAIYCDVSIGAGSDDGFAYAGGEALYATLRHWHADQRVFALIGYSRGAVVASEVAKRLIFAGHNPTQVIYLDGEGCDGDNGCVSQVATCSEYLDGEFQAWTHSALSPIRFDNIYEVFDEDYVAPTLCPPLGDGTDLGGHCRDGCRNFSVGAIFAHTPQIDILGVPAHCVGSTYNEPPIWEYLIGGLQISGGFYTYPDNEPDNYEPQTYSFTSRPHLFNGNFDPWESIAGWLGNGGGATATFPYDGGQIEIDHGSTVLRLFNTVSQTHSYFALPACAEAVTFDVANPWGEQGSLELWITSPGLTDFRLADLPAASLGINLEPKGPFAIPSQFRGRACRIRFDCTLSNPFEEAFADIDNLEIEVSASVLDNPPDPITVNSSCGNATLAFSGSPPPGVTWFWQHQICATRVDLGSEPTFTVPTIGTYYLRARCDQTGAWSAGCGSVQVTSIGCGPAGDFDCNGTVEWADFQWFAGCLDGPDNAPPPNCVDTDIERDGDVDIRDFAVLQRNFAQSCETQAEMVQVAAGPFEMGGSVYDDERPYHWVQLGSYAIDRYEVTNAQYAAGLNWAYAQHNLITVSGGAVRKLGDPSIVYCDLTASSPYSRIVWSENTETFSAVAGRELHPVVMVSWFGAAAYCNWRSAREGRPLCYDLTDWSCNVSLPAYRLPTEAEWEKAAGWDPVEYRHYRYGERTDGCGTNCLDGHRANYSNSGDPFDFEPSLRTTPRGYYNGTNHNGYQTQDARSFYGCYDMSGNVVEWCNDWYSMSYYSTFPPLPPWVDPAGPTTGSHRVLRGGGYENAPNGCRSGVRSSSSQSDAVPTERSRVNGFRCVLGAQ